VQKTGHFADNYKTGVWVVTVSVHVL